MLDADLPPSLRRAISDGEIVALSEREGSNLNCLLLDNFPFLGTFIDWRWTRNHACHRDITATAAEILFPRFFDKHLSGQRSAFAYYVNDGLPLKFRASVAVMEDHIHTFVNLPHTNYFIAADGGWCLTLRMNGDMDYGESPKH